MSLPNLYLLYFQRHTDWWEPSEENPNLLLRPIVWTMWKRSLRRRWSNLLKSNLWSLNTSYSMIIGFKDSDHLVPRRLAFAWKVMTKRLWYRCRYIYADISLFSLYDLSENASLLKSEMYLFFNHGKSERPTACEIFNISFFDLLVTFAYGFRQKPCMIFLKN